MSAGRRGWLWAAVAAGGGLWLALAGALCFVLYTQDTWQQGMDAGARARGYV